MTSVTAQRHPSNTPSRKGSPVEQSPLECLVDGSKDLVNLGMPTGKAFPCVFDFAAVIPGFAFPFFLLADRHEIQKSTARHKIVHEVSARPDPSRRVVLKFEMRHTLGWREAPIRNIAGKSRMFIAEQVFRTT